MANVLQLALGFVEFPDISLKEEVLNRRQCEHLLSNFQEGVRKLQNIINGPSELFHEVEKDLYRIVIQGKMLIDECCNGNWVHATVMQLNNKEGFRELLLDFEYCFYTLCDISCHCNPHEKERILAMKANTTFYPTSMDVVKEDRTSICNRLSKHLDLCNTKDCKDCELVRYLEKYMTSLQRVEGGDLDKIVFPHDYPRPEYGGACVFLGNCVGGAVYQTTWMGLKCAMKVILIQSLEHANKYWKEASILGGLNHPNIIKFFCCGYHEANNQFELIMEFGEMTLSKYLRLRGPLKEMNAVDIMLQIANGMCYLHDMKVAHCDLEPENVVVIPSKDVQLNNNFEWIHVKLLDFGISKVEVKDCPEVLEGQGRMGTLGYMAPEAIAYKLLKVDALKADVFSFGMMCSDILSGEQQQFDTLREYREYIQDSKRPELPRSYSEILRSLVEACWSLDPVKRPTFLDIHRRLIRLKNTMLESSFDIMGVTNDRVGWFWEVFPLYKKFLNFIEWLWIIPQVHPFDNSSSTISVPSNYNGSLGHSLLMEVNSSNMMESSKLIGVQEKLSQLEKQLHVFGSLGIVGMGGIGKSTLAIALSDHISHHFDAICYVIDLKDETCTFGLKHMSRDKEDSPQVETLRKIRDILEGVRKTKKLLLVVDNVSNQGQLCELLGDGMFKGADGMELIASSRDWSSLKQHIPMGGKVNMEILKGNQPMRLFSRHAFRANQSCLPYLEHVAERIVDACCGLPLSLEVMGFCMQGETRLRIWERTLERLLRSRHDGSANEKMWNALRISFDELSNEGKNMFLDIACFFCNAVSTKKETFLRMLDGNAREILEILHNKSLLKVDEWDYLDMHDQLRDMGRMITETKKEFVGTRLFDLNYFAFDNFCKQKDTRLLQGLSFVELECKSKYEVHFEFNPMDELCILNVQCCNNIDILLAIVKASPHLKCLTIQFSIPNTMFLLEEMNFMEKFWNCIQDHLKHLCVLELANCNFSRSVSFENPIVMPLKEIHFQGCENLGRFLNEIVKFTTLESLQISKCMDFEEIPQGLSNLCALKELQFLGCKSLRNILGGFGGLTSLKKLDMWECEALEDFPPGLSNLSKLEELDIWKCQTLRTIPGGFSTLTSLKKLSMWECEALEEFPMGLSNLSSLEELNFSKCRNLRKIPEGFGGLTSLKKLSMWECEALEEFPMGLSNLFALEELYFTRRRNLRKILEGFGG